MNRKAYRFIFILLEEAAAIRKAQSLRFGYRNLRTSFQSLAMLIGMTIWEIRSPTVERRGFLPIATTRGDRLFIGLLSAAYVNLLFVAVSEKLMEAMSLEEEPSIWISFALSMAL